MVKGRMKVGRFQSEKLIGNVKGRRKGYKHVVNTAKLQSFMQSSLTLFIPGLCVFLISGFATLLTRNFQNASDTDRRCLISPPGSGEGVHPDG